MQIRHRIKEAGKTFFANLIDTLAKVAGTMCAFVLAGYALDVLRPLSTESDLTYSDIGVVAGWVVASLSVVFSRKDQRA